MKMFKLILKKLGVAILASLVFSAVLAIISAVLESEESRYMEGIYFDDPSVFLLVFIVTSIVFVIGGIPASILIDKLMKNISFPKRIFEHILYPILYILAGLVVGIIFTFVLDWRIEAYSLVLSMIAAFCFYIVSLIMNKIIQLFKESGE